MDFFEEAIYFSQIVVDLYHHSKMTTRHVADVSIQILKQSFQYFLVCFGEDILIRNKNLDFSAQIFKICGLKTGIILQHIHALKTVYKPLLIL